MLITFAPWSAAQRIPAAIAGALPLPSEPSTFTGITRHAQQILDALRSGVVQFPVGEVVRHG